MKTYRTTEFNLYALKILTVAAPAHLGATVQRVGFWGDTTVYPVMELAAGESIALGPYTAQRNYRVAIEPCRVTVEGESPEYWL